MRFNKLDLNLLVALDALLTDAGISRAAERLFMSQSAMSNALARLREYFDDPLLVQVGRRMELTPRAELLREAVRDVLVRIDSTVAAQPVFDPASSDREFRILASDYTLVTVMPHLLALMHAESRSLRVRLLPQVENPQRALERNDADMLVFPQAYCSLDHPTELLWQEHFVCLACARGAHAGRPLTLERYLQAGHVVMQPPMAQASFETELLERHGLSRRTDVTTYSFASVPGLLVDTDRIATVHGRLAALAQRALPLVSLAPPLPLPAMEQSLQWHKYRTQDPGLQWLRRALHRAVLRMDAALAAQPAGTVADVPPATGPTGSRLA